MTASMGYAAPRKVLCENSTATWCPYCPNVGQAIGMLMDKFGDQLIPFQMHQSDSYSNSWGNSRMSFYGVGPIPDVRIDGVFSQIGSYGNANADANNIGNLIQNRLNNPTDVTLNLCASDSGNDHSIEIQVAIESNGTGRTMRVHCVQTLDGYPSGAQYFNTAIIGPAYSTVTLAPGEQTSVVMNFTLTGASASNPQNVRFIAWAQSTNSSGPSEVYQAAVAAIGEGDCTIDTFTVGPDGDFQTIGDALAASGSGDRIEVAPGTYYENITHGYNVELVSTDGPEVTIIDGGGNAVVVEIYTGQGPGTLLEGFTLRNGDSVLGGGIRSNSMATVRNCIISENTATLGGGIFQQAVSDGLAIESTHFCGNTPNDIHGPWVDVGGNTFDEFCDGETCDTDVNGDSVTDVSDILAIIGNWGPCNACDADINEDGLVDVSDLLACIGAWGPCP